METDPADYVNKLAMPLPQENLCQICFLVNLVKAAISACSVPLFSIQGQTGNKKLHPFWE